MGPMDQRPRSLYDYDLDELRWHWGEAYTIMRDRDGYQAKRKDGRGGWIMRGTASELYDAIHADYDRNPVPRTS